jgi:hypothetical protein
MDTIRSGTRMFSKPEVPELGALAPQEFPEAVKPAAIAPAPNSVSDFVTSFAQSISQLDRQTLLVLAITIRGQLSECPFEVYPAESRAASCRP